jgi:hypothetical protein
MSLRQLLSRLLVSSQTPINLSFLCVVAPAAAMPVMKVMKKILKKGKVEKKVPVYTHYTDTEKALLQTWQEEGKTPTEVADLLGRDLSSVARHFKDDGPSSSKKAMKKVGRPPALTEKRIDRVVATFYKMIEAAYEGMPTSKRAPRHWSTCRKLLPRSNCPWSRGRSKLFYSRWPQTCRHFCQS